MAKYRKKPVVIEAVQFRADHSNTNPGTPDWFVEAVLGRVIVARSDHLIIYTLEGQTRADVDDWIIRGVKNELYPCKPDIFAATYEEVITQTTRLTIEELEKILSEPSERVTINTDGSVTRAV